MSLNHGLLELLIFKNFEFLFVAWSGLLILEFKSLMWGEVYLKELIPISVQNMTLKSIDNSKDNFDFK